MAGQPVQSRQDETLTHVFLTNLVGVFLKQNYPKYNSDVVSKILEKKKIQISDVLSEFGISLKLRFLWWKLKIFITNFSHVSLKRFWRGQIIPQPPIVSFSRGHFFQDGDLQACKAPGFSTLGTRTDMGRFWMLFVGPGYYPCFNGAFFQILCLESCNLVYNESSLLKNIRIKAVW